MQRIRILATAAASLLAIGLMVSALTSPIEQPLEVAVVAAASAAYPDSALDVAQDALSVLTAANAVGGPPGPPAFTLGLTARPNLSRIRNSPILPIPPVDD